MKKKLTLYSRVYLHQDNGMCRPVWAYCFGYEDKQQKLRQIELLIKPL